jgi:hypothetical protein
MRATYVAAAVGVSAGLSAYLPSFVCAGGACSSCFACVGAGGAAVSALLVGMITRGRTARPRPTDHHQPGAERPFGVTTRKSRGRCSQIELPTGFTDLGRRA